MNNFYHPSNYTSFSCNNIRCIHFFVPFTVFLTNAIVLFCAAGHSFRRHQINFLLQRHVNRLFLATINGFNIYKLKKLKNYMQIYIYRAVIYLL